MTGRKKHEILAGKAGAGVGVRPARDEGGFV